VPPDSGTRLSQLRRELLARFPETAPGDARFFSAAGRINLIGEHTDYSDGFCLPAATNRKLEGAFAAAPDGPATVTVHSRQFAEPARFALADIPDLPAGDWRRYITSTAKILQAHARERGRALTGIRAVIDGDIPLGSGLSSSAALELLFLLAMSRLSGFELSPRELVTLGQKAEWEYGVKCGVLDQFAIVNGRRGEVSLIDCRSLEATPVRVDLRGHRFLIGFTKERALAGSAYNQRRAECQRAAEALREASGRSDIRALRDVDLATVERYAGVLDEVGEREGLKLRPRAEHVVSENRRVHLAVDALKRGEVAGFGALMVETHRSLAEKFEVSSPELDAMVDAVLEFSAASGTPAWARMMGGGFGGPVLILVPGNTVEAATRDIAERYRAKTGNEGRFWSVEIEDGLKEIEASS
jgi:galactokinase